MRSILIFLILSTGALYAQDKTRFGIDWIGINIPDFAFQVRARCLLKQVEFNLGLDFNLANTLGRVAGMNVYLKKWGKSEEQVNSLIAGLDYDFTTSGIFHFGEESGTTGSYFIQKSHYLIPSIGFRFYGRDVFLKPSIIKDHSITLGLSYKIPLTDATIIHTYGVVDERAQSFATGYINGGLNVFFKLTFWIGKI